MKTATLSAILFGSASARSVVPGYVPDIAPDIGHPSEGDNSLSLEDKRRMKKEFLDILEPLAKPDWMLNLQCSPKNACDWNCKKWCDCTEKFPWLTHLFHKATEQCAEDDSECDCDDPSIDLGWVPQDVLVKVPPHVFDMILEEPRKPFEFVDPLWDPIPDMMVDVTGAIVCGDWTPWDNPEYNPEYYNQMLDQLNEYDVKTLTNMNEELRFDLHTMFLQRMGQAQSVQSMVSLTEAFLIDAKKKIQEFYGRRRLASSTQKPVDISDVKEDMTRAVESCKKTPTPKFVTGFYELLKKLKGENFFLEDGFEEHQSKMELNDEHEPFMEDAVEEDSITANTTPKHEYEHSAHGYQTSAPDMTVHNPTTDDGVTDDGVTDQIYNTAEYEHEFAEYEHEINGPDGEWK